MKTQNTETQSDGNVTASSNRTAPPASAASGCVRVILPITENKLGLKTALFMGKNYVDGAIKMGGNARCLRSSDSVLIEHTGLTRGQSKSLIDQLISIGYASTLKVSVEERDCPEIDLESRGIIPGEFAWKILDKGFLYALPHYSIMVASWLLQDGKPIFVAKLVPGADRSIIWRRAVDSNAAHRPCAVYWSAKDVQEICGFSLEVLLEGNDELVPPPFRL